MKQDSVLPVVSDYLYELFASSRESVLIQVNVGRIWVAMSRRKKNVIGPDEVEAADAQIRALQRDVKYDLRDFTVDYLVKSFGEDLFFIPDYQREFIWPIRHKSKFIESVILGLPIPMLFVADMADGRLEIVDGAQRIQTLEQFVSGDLRLESLELLTKINGFTFHDLPIAQQRKLLTKALRVVILEDGTSEALRQELFHRINTQSIRARGSEIRRGAYKGPFLDLIKECANNSLFLKLCPISEAAKARRENEELVTRFFAYSERYLSFKHDVDKFLAEFVRSYQEHFDAERLKREFERTIAFVHEHFPYGFAKSADAKITPRVRFEAIAVGVNLALRQDPTLKPKVPVSQWLTSDEFIRLTTTHASNSARRLQDRIEFVRDRLLAG